MKKLTTTIELKNNEIMLSKSKLNDSNVYINKLLEENRALQSQFEEFKSQTASSNQVYLKSITDLQDKETILLEKLTNVENELSKSLSYVLQDQQQQRVKEQEKLVAENRNNEEIKIFKDLLVSAASNLIELLASVATDLSSCSDELSSIRLSAFYASKLTAINLGKQALLVLNARALT